MLVVCCGMYRSGSTLHYQIAGALVEAAGVGARAGWDWASADVSLARPGAGRTGAMGVIKVHEPHPEPGVEAGLDPDGVLYIYSHRDLRDVVVSYAANRDKIVLDGDTGFEVPTLDHRALSNALARIIGLGHADRRAMGARGRDHVANRFHPDRILEETVALYDRLIGEKVRA